MLQVGEKCDKGPYEFGRTFPIGQDWSNPTDLSFWYYGRNGGTNIAVNLANDRASPSIPSAQWQLAWNDEFDSKRRTAPNPSSWANEVGDGTAYGIPGWGNDELEYYMAGGDNAATDGKGNLVITTKAADGSLQCYYGPCKAEDPLEAEHVPAVDEVAPGERVAERMRAASPRDPGPALSAVRLMRGIDPRHAAFLEAIGFGLDTVDLVYRRLAATLRGLDPAPSPLIFADAWAIVDWMDRIDSGPATHPSATAPSARLSAHGWARSRS